MTRACTPGSGSGPVEAGNRKDRDAPMASPSSTEALPSLTTSTVIFPPHRPVFFDQDDVDAATEATNQAIGEHLALLGICWGDDDA